ncbi:MAG TPA: TRAP transporter substrate-binding protein [Vineibacter sp.]|nr:TRAP transporter substrate-binding protein [Vineibacter sp.]
MNRRKFVRTAGAAATASAAVAAPAIAQSMPEIKWRAASSFPKSLDTLFGGLELFCRRVGELTDGKLKVQPFASGEIVPGLQVLDAVQNGTVELGQTAAYYYIGKDVTFAFDTAVPFGLNTRQHFAWWIHGGGREAMNEFYKEYNVQGIMFGGTGAQMGGWFRKQIQSVDDLKGLKFRIGGFAGQVLTKLGVVPQQIAGGEIYPALEKGTIDAAEWVGPYDDEKLGFNKVAPYYYYPGWWEGAATGTMYINSKSWSALPPLYQRAVEAACAEVTLWMIGKYDHVNPAALRKLVAGGSKLSAFPVPVLEACMNAANELYAETAAKNAKFAKIYDSWKAYRNEQVLWFRVAEGGFDGFMARQSAQNKL